MKTLLLALTFAAVVSAQSVTLTWTNATGNPAGTLTVVERANGACGATGQAFARVTATPVSGGTFTDTTALRGQVYSYRAKHVFVGVESPATICKDTTIPLNAPGNFSLVLDLAGVITGPDGTKVAFSRVELRPVVAEVK